MMCFVDGYCRRGLHVAASWQHDSAAEMRAPGAAGGASGVANLVTTRPPLMLGCLPVLHMYSQHLKMYSVLSFDVRSRLIECMCSMDGCSTY